MTTPTPVPLQPQTPSPVYTFRVNNLDYSSIYASIQPDENIENVINQLKNAVIFIEEVGPVKYGDIFTLVGEKAKRVLEVAKKSRENSKFCKKN